MLSDIGGTSFGPEDSCKQRHQIMSIDGVPLSYLYLPGKLPSVLHNVFHGDPGRLRVPQNRLHQLPEIDKKTASLTEIVKLQISELEEQAVFVVDHSHPANFPCLLFDVGRQILW